MNEIETTIFNLDCSIPKLFRGLFRFSEDKDLEHRTILLNGKIVESDCLALETLFYIRPIGVKTRTINYSINLVQNDHYEQSDLTKIYPEDLPGVISRYFSFMKDTALDLLMDLFSEHIKTNAYQTNLYYNEKMLKIKHGRVALVLIDESK